MSGFCFVTFSEHSSAVSGVTFSSSGKVVVSASLDGTVRAFDLHRLVSKTQILNLILLSPLCLPPDIGIFGHLLPPAQYSFPV